MGAGTRGLAGVVAAGLALLASALAPSALAAGSNPELLGQFGRVPLHFERNDGQWDAEVRFLARGPGYALFLTAEGPVLKLLPARSGSTGLSDKAGVVRMRLGGSSRASSIEPASSLSGVSHYYLGADRSRWRTNQRHFERVTYTGVYPGIDVAYHGNQRQLEYDFLVQPLADPGLIRMRFEGARAVKLDPQGTLVLRTAAGTLVEQAPVAYQEAHGRRTDVPVRFELRGHEARFRVGAYDKNRPLVIDPLLVYSTYLGGSAGDVATGVAVDASGSACVVGSTPSTDFPRLNAHQNTYGGGLYDVFVTKFSPAGNALVFSTFLGGAGRDQADGVALDPAGNIHVTGWTNSGNFPTLEAYQASLNGTSDAFVAKLSPTGVLQYSTYLGGGAGDAASSIALNAAGEATVAGNTTSTNFPTTAGAYQTDQGGTDAFVTRLTADGSSLLASTYLGGNNLDLANAVALDAAGYAYVTGDTDSTNFPTLNPYQANQAVRDAFVTKLNPALSVLSFSTYLGGSNQDFATGIVVNGAGQAFVAGYTDSTDFPTINAYQADQPGSDGFITRFSASGSSVVSSTYLGGSGFEFLNSVGIDLAGNVYVAGDTGSTDFPTLNAVHGDRPLTDGFVTKLAPNGRRLLYSTYLGGSLNDNILGLAVGLSGNVYVVGYTASADFPTANPFQAALNGSLEVDALVTQLSGFVKGDCNCDGQTDLVFHNNVSGQNEVWVMNGVTRIGAASPIIPDASSLDWLIAGVDDFNGDEMNDLVFWNQASGATEIWRMNGFVRQGAAVPLAATPALPWRLSATADFNWDGRPDLVWRNYATQQISIWTMNGTTKLGTLVPTPAQAVDANWEIVAALDYNGDSYTDLLWYNATSGKIVMWFMDQNVQRITGQFTNPANAGANNWKVLAGGDYGIGPGGLPGTKDIVWRNATSGKVVVWYMNRAGTRTAGTFTTPDAPSPNPTDWTIAGPR